MFKLLVILFVIKSLLIFESCVYIKYFFCYNSKSADSVLHHTVGT